MGKVKKLSKRIIVCVSLFFVLIFILANWDPKMAIDVYTFNDEWKIEYENGDESTIVIPGVLEDVRVKEIFTIKKDISDNEETLMFVIEYASVIATIDGEEIGRWGFENGMFVMPGRRLVSLNLDDYDGKTLELVFKKYTNNYMEPFYIGSASDLAMYSVYSSLPVFLLGVILIILGIFLVFLYLLDSNATINKNSNLFLGIFSIIAGLYIPGRTLFIYMFLSPNQIMITYMILQYLLPISVLTFALSISKTSRRLIGFALAIHCICYPIISLNQMLNSEANIYILAIFQYLHLSYYILAFAAIFIESRNCNAQLKRIGLGLLIIVAGYLLDILEFRVVENIDTPFLKASLVAFIAVQCTDRTIQFIKNSSDIEARLKTADYKAEILLENIKKTSAQIEEMRLIKHDINSHINLIGSMLEDENIVGVKRYIGNIAKYQALKSPIAICQNPIIDAILNRYIKKADEKMIDFDYKIAIKDKIEMDDNDLCSLLVNMLDNAMEACEGLEGSWMEFDCHMKNDFLCMTCRNGINKQVERNGKIFKSNKADKSGHGYGIKIMNKVVEKYNGIINIFNDRKVFSVEIAIPLQI